MSDNEPMLRSVLSSILRSLRRPGRPFFSLALAAILLGMGASVASAGTRVSEVSFTARSDGQGYVIRVRTADTINAYSMPRSIGEHRIRWVLYNASLHSDYEKVAPKGPVKRYTVNARNGHLVFNFHLHSDQAVEAEAYRDAASTDLLLNLRYEGTAPVAESKDRSESSSNVVRTVSSGSQGSSGASKAARERWKLDTVVIDPGHGGKDPGATAHGLLEKNIVLDVAHKLGDYIENRLGINVVYTRTGDKFIPLEERGHMANKAGAKLFISLHANAAHAHAAHGTETYFLGPSKTEAAEKVMERENSVIKYEENSERYEDYDEQALVRQTLTQSAYMRQSQKLAEHVQNQFEERVRRDNRGVHQAGFYVLWSASMPSVLVELGFLTNPREAHFLNSERGQTLLASGIFRAVRDYKKEYEKGIFASE